MSPSWIVNVAGRAYGPYTDAQMQAFSSEGRLAPQSLVARNGDTQFRAAADEPALAALFGLHKMPDPPNPAPAATVTPIKPADAPSAFGQKDDPAKPGERAHIIIIADMKSRSIDGLEEEIYKLGPAFAFLPQAWLLSTDMSVNAIRNLLVQQLGKLDALFLVDATRDKAAWFNFGPEADTRIRRNWARTPEPSTNRSAAG
jgi:GYF domain 2